MQWKIDSLLRLYQAGKYELGRGEYEQIGFRLATKLGINHIYCVDEWGKHYENINELLNKHDSREDIAFENSYDSHPESIKEFHPESVIQDNGRIAELISLNKPEKIRRSVGNYLIGHFKYESEPHD